MEFRWNEWNLLHIAKHGINAEEAETVVVHARSPWPRGVDSKYLVWGRGRAGRLLQVIFVLDNDFTKYIIHARLLNEREKHLYRRAGGR
jgi:uncharacterized DUF497 family protein